MNMLLVCATLPEIERLQSRLIPVQKENDCLAEYKFRNHQIFILVTGIGSVNTAYRLMKTLQTHQFDILINAGIAGSFSPHIQIGQVVCVEEEIFADLAIEDQQGIHNLFEMNLVYENQYPFKKGKLENKEPFPVLSHLKKVRAITVNTAHGSTESIRFFNEKYNADIENMEGAAFTYICLMEKLRFVQIRSISNYVEPRDFSKWNIALAVEGLTSVLLQFFDAVTD